MTVAVCCRFHNDNCADIEEACCMSCPTWGGCEYDPPHPEHPCGRRVIDGVTRCSVCGELDGSPECEANGCWRPATQADLDALIVEGMLNRG